MARRQQHNPHATPVWPFVGMIGMAAAFFLYAASGLVAPWWAVVALLVLWCAAFVVATRWWTPHPRRVVLLALGGATDHTGRDGVAYASWDATEGAPPQEIALPADVPVLSA